MRNVASRRALNTPELLTLILYELGDATVEVGVGSDLVSCLMVSKLWSENAVPIIWNTCDDAALGLFGLIEPLDTSGVPVRFVPSTKKSHKFAGWPRFLHYMSRIRTLKISLLRDPRTLSRDAPAQKWIHPNVIRTAALIAESHGQSLCASVQKWSIALCEPDACEVLVHLLHGQTKSLDFQWLRPAVPIDATSFRVMFIRLQHMCPNIEDLAIDFDVPHSRDTFKAEIPPALKRLTKLSCLTLPPYLLTPTVWHAVQSSSTLEQLIIPNPFPLSGIDRPVKGLPPALEVLELSIECQHLSHFFASAPCETLSDVTIVVHRTAAHPVQLASLCEKVADIAPNTTIFALAVLECLETPAPTWFTSLARLKLTELDVCFDSLNDNHLDELLRACPALQTLKIRPVRGTSLGTIATLATIARSCRQIEHVTARLDCDLGPTPDGYREWPGFSETLKELNMECSPIRDTGLVGGIMCQLFRTFVVPITAEWSHFASIHPSLRPETQTTLLAKYRERWQTVSTALHDFHNVLGSPDAHASCGLEEKEELEEVQAELEALRAKTDKLQKDKERLSDENRKLRAEAKKSQTETRKLQTGSRNLQKRIDSLERENEALKAARSGVSADSPAIVVEAVDASPKPKRQTRQSLNLPTRTSGRLSTRRTSTASTGLQSRRDTSSEATLRTDGPEMSTPLTAAGDA